MAEDRNVSPSRKVRFGAFELDVRTAELRKHGIRVRLHEQPFRILAMLLDHPGEVVLRDEIRNRLWPNNTVVEFDHSINAAIQRLRDALADSADKPRYVETVARRGYRFIGSIEAEIPAAVVEVAGPPPAAEPVAAVDTSDLSGQTSAHFRVIGKLGSGGMGVVYRAEDLKLGRQVALKFLPLPAKDAPAGLVERFQREARSASALNHPNICTIYGVDEFAGQPVIVMELLEGETLEARLAKGALGLAKALPLALQLAEALDAAHRKGIVHRDLKPANIMLTKSGVKVLDFGLAKMERAIAGAEETLIKVTVEGTILGTWQYMSPEQAQGKDADARSDIFSFGLVFYEMISGKPAFEGSNPASIIAAILEKEAPALEPEGLNRVVRACLAKDPAERFQCARDLKRAIEWGVSGDGQSAFVGGAPLAGGGRLWRLGWGVALVLAVGLAVVGLLHFRERPAAPQAPARFQILAQEHFAPPALSPDGRKVVYFVGDRMWVQFLDSGESRELTVTESWVPFWSPDSRFIAYRNQGKLKKIEAAGGTPQTVTDLAGPMWGGGTWNQEDVIVFGDVRSGLFRVPASGGVPIPITALDPARHETYHLGPSFLPDGRHFVYLRASSDAAKSAIYLGSVDAGPEQQTSEALVASHDQPTYATSADPSSGYLLFVREGELMAQAFDQRRLALQGRAAQVVAQIESVGGWASVSASASDVLLFRSKRARDLQATWFDREGKVAGTVGESGAYYDLALSPDGTQLAVGRESGDLANIWLMDLARGGAAKRFTFGSARDSSPVWSPDGGSIVFSSKREGADNLYRKPVSGMTDEELLLKSSEDKRATGWSRDGRFLLYTAIHPRTKADIWVLPLGGERKPFPFLVTEANERFARFSPDGRWVAYTSNESNGDEVYVRPFSLNSAGTAAELGGKWPISNGFGQSPRWRSDGRELDYISFGKLNSVEIAAGPAFRAGNSEPLGVRTTPPWESSADCTRFMAFTNKGGPQPYTLVMNWHSGLKK